MVSTRRYFFYGISILLIAIALFFQNKATIHPEFDLLIRPLLLAGIAATSLLFPMKDVWMKTLLIVSLLFFAASFIFFESETKVQYWFVIALTCSGGFYIAQLLAGRRRNFKSMELSTLRRHPWISAIFMAAGFFLFNDIEAYLSGKKLLLIILIAVAILAGLVVIERYNQVHPRSFIFMLLGLVLAMVAHGIQLHYSFHRTPDVVPFIITLLTGLSGVFSVIGAVCYEDRLIGSEGE